MTPGLRIETKSDRHLGRWLVLLVVTGLLIVACYYGYSWYTKGVLPPVPLPASAMADPSIDESTITEEQIDAHTVPAAQPRYISIPALGIYKVRILGVGLTENKLLDTPKNINDTAWYNKSATPGSGSGAVVIDGHNGGVTKDGVFAKLADLSDGDKITIERGDGKQLNYLVVTNKVMTLEEANKTGMRDMMMSANPAKEGLSLITCAGTWIPRDKVFDKRVMVRAVAQ